ncbi:unnamed protein product [Ambrosiozyma monospora]|uniref:Unnamed protein product n=1 Tax=Ambrosiozyma monospora TaxID=43982 RepID=A0ACB5TQA3_AMBMO|nr:unnamed protein product [Ambrosiozyma monospora]
MDEQSLHMKRSHSDSIHEQISDDNQETNKSPMPIKSRFAMSFTKPSTSDNGLDVDINKKKDEFGSFNPGDNLSNTNPKPRRFLNFTKPSTSMQGNETTNQTTDLPTKDNSVFGSVNQEHDNEEEESFNIFQNNSFKRLQQDQLRNDLNDSSVKDWEKKVRELPNPLKPS